MKLAHLADTHLGFRQLSHTNDAGRNEREQDIYDAFERAIDRIIELRPDVVIHAGDLFDGYHPSSSAIVVAFDQLSRLKREQIPTVVIAGNHSTPRVASTQHVFDVLNRLGCVRAVHVRPEVIEIGELAITAVPHCNDPAQLREWIVGAQPSTGHRFNVLVAHVGLDGLGHVGSAEAGNTMLAGETLEAVSAFDYIAMGHLHKFFRPRINAVYAGSLERLTWADDARSKGVVEVRLGADQLADEYVTFHPIKSRMFKELSVIDASKVNNLTDAIVAAASDELKGAVVKLPIRNVTVGAYGALDRRRIAAAFDRCLHLELDPEFIDLGTDGLPTTAPPDLRDFLSARVPHGVEASEFIARAEGYMTKAAEEIGA